MQAPTSALFGTCWVLPEAPARGASSKESAEWLSFAAGPLSSGPGTAPRTSPAGLAEQRPAVVHAPQTAAWRADRDVARRGGRAACRIGTRPRRAARRQDRLLGALAPDRHRTFRAGGG